MNATDNINSTATVNTEDEIIQLVSFNIGEEVFGVEILKVQEIIRMVEITKVPNSPEFVEGVINLRGKIIPIIDLRRRLNFDDIKRDISTRIMVVELDSNVIGFIVDSVNEVLRISSEITEQPPAIVKGIKSDYISKIAKMEGQLITLLDLERILSAKESEDITEIAA